MEVLIWAHNHSNTTKIDSQHVILSIFALWANLMGVPLISKFILTLHLTHNLMFYPTNIIILKSDNSNVT